jgi:hypothetical protein
MTAAPPGEPSPRALSETLAALAAQLADLRGQIRTINERLDQAGLHPCLNLAGRFEDLAQTVAGTPDAASPRGPAAPSWIGLDRDTYHAQLTGLRHWADTVLPSGNCPPWPPNGTAPTAGRAPTSAALWSSTTGGCPALCAASPTSPAHACRIA